MVEGKGRKRVGGLLDILSLLGGTFFLDDGRFRAFQSRETREHLSAAVLVLHEKNKKRKLQFKNKKTRFHRLFLSEERN